MYEIGQMSTLLFFLLLQFVLQVLLIFISCGYFLVALDGGLGGVMGLWIFKKS
jgi:hypothetical protein